MVPPQVVIDTNVLISGLRSKRGASHKLLMLIGKGRFEVNVSVPVVLEYEMVTRRQVDELHLDEDDIGDVLDYICSQANQRKVFYLWRPFLQDPNDDMFLELAVAANCDFIITHNVKHFAGTERFGVQAVTPREFLQRAGELQ